MRGCAFKHGHQVPSRWFGCPGYLLKAGVCVLQAWRWSPDTLAMSTWIAAEENEPDALAMLAGAARLPAPGVRLRTQAHCIASICK